MKFQTKERFPMIRQSIFHSAKATFNDYDEDEKVKKQKTYNIQVVFRFIVALNT